VANGVDPGVDLCDPGEYFGLLGVYVGVDGE
jgi:hypothetical protein